MVKDKGGINNWRLQALACYTRMLRHSLAQSPTPIPSMKLKISKTQPNIRIQNKQCYLPVSETSASRWRVITCVFLSGRSTDSSLLPATVYMLVLGSLVHLCFNANGLYYSLRSLDNPRLTSECCHICAGSVRIWKLTWTGQSSSLHHHLKQPPFLLSWYDTKG